MDELYPSFQGAEFQGAEFQGARFPEVVFPEISYPEEIGTMIIGGTGTVKAEPDIAEINIGVITENSSLKAAQEENSTKINAIINSLIRIGVTKDKISTASYSIVAQYDFVEGKQVFRGYRVSNILLVMAKNISRIGEIIDTATANGANNIGNIYFSVQDSNIYYKKALNLAIRNSIEKGKEIARTINTTLIVTPYKILEIDTGISPREETMAKFALAATPILPGQISITANITAYFHYYL